MAVGLFLINLRLQNGTNADDVRFAGEVSELSKTPVNIIL